MNDTEGKWSPTPAEVFMATLVVLSDTLPTRVDAYLLHASPVRDLSLDRGLLDRGVQIHREKGAMIVINGLTFEQCQELNVAYPGFEEWVGYLQQRHVRKEGIIVMPPSANTAAESANFLALAREHNWQSLAIGTQPHQQTRAFLQMIRTMNNEDWFLTVYNAPAPPISWSHEMIKPIPKGTAGGDVIGDYKDHIQGEFDRIVRYARNPGVESDNTPEFNPHATIPDMIRYLAWRASKEA